MQSARGRLLQRQRRQTHEKAYHFFVGLDVHKDSIAMGVAEAGREAPRFVGTVSPLLGASV